MAFRSDVKTDGKERTNMFFYNLIIQPLVFLISIIFVILYDTFQEPGASVILLSIIVNIIALPLYRQADRIQKDQQKKQNQMQQWIDHIKSGFKGDERYMMLSAYYKVEKYHPASVLKESFPLLLQIPIFIAAYRYLSAESVLIGASFGPIMDLGSPDRLIRIGGMTINFLPILMTILNLASGYVYSRNASVRQKIQLIGIALIFLVLLYNSPSGLVLYWTTSQCFSLCRNLAQETKIFKNRAFVLTICFVIIIFNILDLAFRFLATPADVIISEFLLILAIIQIVLIILKLKGISLSGHVRKLQNFDRILPDTDYTGFLWLCICCAVFFGVCIPSSVLSASAIEFVDAGSGRFLTELLTYPATVYFGFFVVWGSVYYYFMAKKGRKVLFSLLLSLLCMALLNFFAFDVKPEFFYADLSFDGLLDISKVAIVLNIVITALVILLALFCWKKRQKLCKNVAGILAIALVALGSYNIVQIPLALNSTNNTVSDTKVTAGNYDGILSLSSTEKNVIVIMLDRALGSYVPYIFDEKPELKEAYDGFVFYPNTISFAGHTMEGAPPLYGGYEYTPAAIAERPEANVNIAKQEAIKMLPVLFNNSGYKTTIADPSLYGIALFDDYPDINALELAGKFNRFAQVFEDNIRPTQRRNFVIYSIFKTVPLFLKEDVYDNGGYLLANRARTAYTQSFIDNYSTLMQLPELMSCEDNSQGSYIFMKNLTTHEPALLEAPDYEIKPGKSRFDIPYGERTVDGRTMRIESLESWKLYCSNMAAYRALADWLAKLKELGVYDNTRIIIAADHGAAVTPAQFIDWVLPDGYDAEHVNPVLMVKDFNTSGELTTSTEFMTNADVPTLATAGLIEDPTNPFTGKSISSESKETGALVEKKALRVKESPEDKLVIDDYDWWEVKDNIFDLNNWKLIEGGNK